jgi:23S rRNA (pseudouridine1915-N3)-methyltransferase
MIKARIRCVGKPSESWHQQAIHSYEERLAPFAHLETVELQEGHKNSAKPDIAKTKAIEAESLLKGIPKDAWVVALDETGKELDSPTLAKSIAEWTEGGRTVVFLIGGSWGLDASVKERANAVLSFGKITLPHALARIILLEQLYRAAMINAGKTYHK